MAAGLLRAGPGGFQRAARFVQPDVAAGDHLPGDMDIVIFNEDQMAFQLAVFAEMNDMLNVAFAVVISRMGLASKYELDRTLRVVHQLHDVFELLEDEGRALIGGKAARETNGERVGVQQMIEGNEVADRQALTLEQQAPACELDQ